MVARGFDVTVAYPSVSVSSWTLIPERLPDESFDRVVVPSTSYTGSFWSIEAASLLLLKPLYPEASPVEWQCWMPTSRCASVTGSQAQAIHTATGLSTTPALLGA